MELFGFIDPKLGRFDCDFEHLVHHLLVTRRDVILSRQISVDDRDTCGIAAKQFGIGRDACMSGFGSFRFWHESNQWECRGTV